MDARELTRIATEAYALFDDGDIGSASRDRLPGRDRCGHRRSRSGE